MSRRRAAIVALLAILVVSLFWIIPFARERARQNPGDEPVTENPAPPIVEDPNPPPVAAPPTSRVKDSVPVPPGARVTISSDKKQYFLGESIDLHFVLENVGKTGFLRPRRGYRARISISLSRRGHSRGWQGDDRESQPDVRAASAEA